MDFYNEDIMQITLDYIYEKYKHRTFYLYHILGKKWGCTLDIETRLRDQNFTKNDCDEIKEVIGIKVADRLEKFLNEREGYSYNHTQGYISALSKRLKGLANLDYSKRNNTNIGKHNKGRKHSNQTKKLVSIKSKQAHSNLSAESYNRMIHLGSENGNSKYTEEQARFVKKYYFKQKNQFSSIPEGKMSSKQIIDKLGVTKKFIHDIYQGKTWKHINP